MVGQCTAHSSSEEMWRCALYCCWRGLRRLASCVCCAAVRPCLPDILLSYGQVGVGVEGGLEIAIHSVWTFIERNSLNEGMCCLKIDMKMPSTNVLQHLSSSGCK